MKTKLFFIAFIFSSSFLFAQINEEKSSWVGGGFNSYYTGADAGHEFYIAGSEFDQITIGDEITKVKFYHFLGTLSFSSGPITFNNTQYTIKIYENPSLTGPYSGLGFYNTTIGDPVFSQTITLGAAESDQIYELTFSESYTVNENDFWVAVCFDNGKGAMRTGDVDELSEGKYYMHWDRSDLGVGILIGKPNFSGSFTEPEYSPLGISIFVDDGEVYEEQSDLTIKYCNTYPNHTSYITEKAININEDLIIYPIILNNGPDATSNIATINATINGNVLIENTEIDLSESSSLGNGNHTVINTGGAITVTATQMNEWEIAGLCDVCFTVTYTGSDPISANNTTCLTLTRGQITPTECDLQALFVTSTTDLTPIASDISIGLTDDITLLPAVKNNGPDNANNFAQIKITATGVPMPIEDYSKNLTGLLSEQTILLAESGSTVTAELMDLAGLTTFDVCLTVTYAGTDNNIENNETCITITREDPSKSLNNNISTISAYPNPASSVITVANAENENIVVLNMLGEVVANISNASSNQTIDISNLSNGTYFVKVNSEVFKINLIK
ncbi:MAG: T9SS type A sorting domain-containing protein [Bacteroidales bacterium]|nr:T9SS type A sorting domain-containing protein [Bacteroidales bacterium]